MRESSQTEAREVADSFASGGDGGREAVFSQMADNFSDSGHGG
ncbi:hypothetical protein A2U01_0096010 [Trifolium medium]|uniref:Uncharacterized protein n=1 Tax=Trifolium medium TaxID=97028 RepID=A0A392UQJ6_9FABA|nr:hypothetical protein [Trifolium medium]